MSSHSVIFSTAHPSTHPSTYPSNCSPIHLSTYQLFFHSQSFIKSACLLIHSCSDPPCLFFLLSIHPSPIYSSSPPSVYYFPRLSIHPSIAPIHPSTLLPLFHYRLIFHFSFLPSIPLSIHLHSHLAIHLSLSPVIIYHLKGLLSRASALFGLVVGGGAN